MLVLHDIYICKRRLRFEHDVIQCTPHVKKAPVLMEVCTEGVEQTEDQQGAFPNEIFQFNHMKATVQKWSTLGKMWIRYFFLNQNTRNIIFTSFHLGRIN